MIEKDKHTPGPWRWVNDSTQPPRIVANPAEDFADFLVGPANEDVFRAFDYRIEIYKAADAELIRSAPEMAARITELEAEVEQLRSDKVKVTLDISVDVCRWCGHATASRRFRS